jgi:hypothetical protein
MLYFLLSAQLDAPTGTTPTKQTHTFPAFEATKVSSEKLEEDDSQPPAMNVAFTRTLSGTSSASTSSTSSVDTASLEVVKSEEAAVSGSVPIEPVKLSNRSTSSSKNPSSSHSSSASHKISDASQSRIAQAGGRVAKTKSLAGASMKARTGTASSASRATNPSSGHGEKFSALAIPKRYRAKSPLGEATNLR